MAAVTGQPAQKGRVSQLEGKECIGGGTDIEWGVFCALDALEGASGRVLPGLVEELVLAATEAVLEPSLCGVVEEGTAVEEGDAVLGERVRVLGNAGVVDAGGDEEGEGEREERGGAHSVRGGGGLEG